MVRVYVAGTPVETADAATVLDAIRASGRELPTLCHDDRLMPRGSCRICLVAADRRAVAACTTPVHDGMMIDPGDPVARAAARGTLELIVSELPARALGIPPERSELVRVCASVGVERGAFTGAVHTRGTDDSHPYIGVDRDLCIACGRCVAMCADVQGTFALELAGRGFDTVVTAGDGGAWAQSPCVSCGGCVDSCPTGALYDKHAVGRTATATTTTTCGYCGVGCALDVHTDAAGIVAVTPTHHAPVNRGHACVKGRFAHGFVTSGDRLTQPLLRAAGRGSPLRPATWEEALAYIARELTRVRDTHGGDAIGMICSARATNEENYLAQKIARTVLRTNNIDNCSRLCHAPTAAGLTASFGFAGGTNSFDDLDRADCILVAGANPTEAHPVVGSRIVHRVHAGARLVVVDPRRTELADLADVHLRGVPGSNVAVFNALARLLLDSGQVDHDYLRDRTTGLDELTALLADYSAERVAAVAGVPASALADAARLFGSARHPVILYGLGITEHAHGTDGVRTLANLALLRGTVGTADGCGVLPLRGQNNVQGASDMGALPDVLPGYQRLADPAVRERFSRGWGVPIPERPGLRIPAMFGAALDGGLRALYVIGEDLVSSDPDAGHVRAALAACELVISQDVFLSRTAELADVVLPAASFLEKDGTFVNFDRRFQRVRPALDPPGGVRTDFDILRAVAAALGADPGCPTPAAALDECVRLTPAFGGISHDRLDRVGPLHWPCPDPGHPGTPVLHLDRFATADGRAALAARPYLSPGEEPDAEYPFVLVTGRRLAHYNTGSMTRRTPNAELLAGETLDIAPDDAAALGVGAGDPVEIRSRRGRMVLSARPTDEVAPGQVFTAFHFPQAPTNELTSRSADEVTDCPEYKVTAVTLRSFTKERK
ncbi:formate dehydrogenase subunit alpha [Nocardia otitidiscaviarum]|uniref:formate dehydrogenase subunit alpha n=1 Tax=Nocardia otitidiscaviarum TaxID=1823 RepID=UPI0018939F2E|nr:formate dehydrogenase subunit alpha [Nocardia otitidiscaviarum]MBF6182245.1 formate dehydrogenase subunit alpha [Nocardia otitidiscaviarum]